MNKAIQAQLAPGSTFKIIMSVAGLQEGIAQNMQSTATAAGALTASSTTATNTTARSIFTTPSPFLRHVLYMLGDKLGIDRIAKYATAFGYGQKTGIDLPGEQAGLMPSAQWKMKNYHNRWYPDETLDVAIGQGAVEATPLQLARIIGGIASGGAHGSAPRRLPRPASGGLPQGAAGELSRLRRRLRSHRSRELDTSPTACTRSPSPAYFHTAGSAHLEGIDFGGKTGTAQVMSHEALDKTSKGKSTNPNVWFVGVTPRRNPELVVAVLWQNGKFSYYPARIGAKIVSAYVEKQRRLANNLPHPRPPRPWR
jgi:penicillin-binding protein 2